MTKISRAPVNIYFFLFFWFWWLVVWLNIFFFRIIFFKSLKSFFKKLFFPNRKKSIFYLEVFSPESAGNRHRTKKWVEILNQNNFKVRSAYVFEYREYLQLTSSENTMPFFLMSFMWIRFWQIMRSSFCDVIVVRRELLMFNDYGNLFFEKLLASLHSVRVLDFDDDISAAKREPKTISSFGKMLLEHPKKFSASLKHYTHFFPATNYLRDLLKQSFPSAKDENILVLPTCVDYNSSQKKNYNSLSDEIVIGWVGARNNLGNLHLVVNALNWLSSKYKFRLRVVCDAPFAVPVLFPVESIRWSEKFEIENLLSIDIGIMPLENSLEQKGKAAFKLIQYMGLGIVSMATALTVNTEVIDDGVNGFLVPQDADWTPYFEKVFQKRNQFAEIGARAKTKIEMNYSFAANQQRLLNFFQSIK